MLLFIPPLLDAVNGYMKSEGACSVVMVVDGDTVKLDCEDGDYKSARILGYDAPEKNAQCIAEYIKANRAAWALRWAMWFADKIEIQKTKLDKYGRDLVILSVDGRDVASHMIASDLARSYQGGKRQGWCGH
ncbi:thermonuclease family protein [Amylibacter sp. SFDW26]|uniref:thermonuclease family protein n=1 Tax=Amylibacter sp. SFDW26 TaxID=2652722 RepID=UPI00186A88B8|nr:thermonuclease family protein [Amylibacter sp. SFDW26]